MRNQCRKPVVTAVQGICFTVGIEMALAGDIVVAAEGSRFCQMEAKRGIAPLGGAHFRFLTRAGWGNAMYHLMLCDEFGAEEGLPASASAQEVVPHGRQSRARHGDRPASSRAMPRLASRSPRRAGRKFIEAGERRAIDVIPTYPRSA
jgi:enoyl-CoA hydratase/carnithine racemase